MTVYRLDEKIGGIEGGNCCGYYHPCGGRPGRSDHRHQLEYARRGDAVGRCDYGSIHPVGSLASDGQREITYHADFYSNPIK